MTQVRQQNMESQRKQNKERAMRKLLKKITTDRPSDKAVPEVGVIILWFLLFHCRFFDYLKVVIS